MSLIRYLTRAKPTKGFYIKELSIAGLKSNDIQTLFVLEIMQVINKHTEDKDTYSMWYALDICKQLMYGSPITPIDDPLKTGEYIAHSKTDFQSTRLASLFYDSRLKLWYDINHVSLRNKIYRFIAKFFKKPPEFTKPHLLYYISEFPYTPPYDKFLNS